MDLLDAASQTLDSARSLSRRIEDLNAFLTRLTGQVSQLESAVGAKTAFLRSKSQPIEARWAAVCAEELQSLLSDALARVDAYRSETMAQLEAARTEDQAYGQVLTDWVETVESDSVAMSSTSVVTGGNVRKQIEELLEHIATDATMIAETTRSFTELESAVTGYARDVETAVAKLSAALPKYEPQLTAATVRLNEGLTRGRDSLKTLFTSISSDLVSKVSETTKHVGDAVDRSILKPIDEIKRIRQNVEIIVGDLQRLQKTLEDVMSGLGTSTKAACAGPDMVISVAEKIDKIVTRIDALARKAGV